MPTILSNIVKKLNFKNTSVRERIISISMIKNEVDIIELFIRYNLKFLDAMIVLENGSYDKTKDILIKLEKEGLPIFLFKTTD
jgi:hypothetical protein